MPKHPVDETHGATADLHGSRAHAAKGAHGKAHPSTSETHEAQGKTHASARKAGAAAGENSALAGEADGSTEEPIGATAETDESGEEAGKAPPTTKVIGSGGRLRNKIIFGLVGLGVLLALVSAYFFARPPKPQPPLYKPAADPYAKGIFANGIIESYQAHGENINIYPEVTGTIREILVAEGSSVTQGTPLLAIDDTVQRATTEQQKSQLDAAMAVLDELKAQPRKENLEVFRAQVGLAAATLKSAQDTLDKQQRSYDLDSRSVSKDTLDTDRNAAKVARANLDVAARQLDLTKAGAWVYDIENQQRQVEALGKAWAASMALLAKYTIRAPTDGAVLSIQSAVGSYVSPQGAYDTYTQGFDPIVVMGTGKSGGGYMSVRCYIDEILIPKMPPADKMTAMMTIRGTTTTIPLEFVRLQPYVTPKIELSDQRLEKVDLRVLPAIFRFQPPAGVEVYPGEMVDVYVGEQKDKLPPPVLGKL